jgi:hypothetical protein
LSVIIGEIEGGLPEGEIIGDHIEAVDDGEGQPEVQWVSGAFTGFSARFNSSFDALGVRDAILKILQFTYLAPLVSLSASGNSLREKGTPVTSTTLTASVTKRTDNVARIQFFYQGSPIAGADFEPPSNVGTGNTTYGWTGSFSDNVTFRVDVTDDGVSGGPTTVSASTTFSFVYPYYYGADVPGITAAAVAALTKNVIASSANVNRSFVHAGGDVFYFAYPASYGALTSILDQNGFETISSWTLRTENITGLDTNAVSYRIYEFNNVQAAGTSSFTFIR